MFVGMIFMEMGMKSVHDDPAVVSFLSSYQAITVSKYLLLIVAGFAAALTHSSSLVTGVMIAMSAQGLCFPA